MRGSVSTEVAASVTQRCWDHERNQTVRAVERPRPPNQVSSSQSPKSLYNHLTISTQDYFILQIRKLRYIKKPTDAKSHDYNEGLGQVT